MRRAASSPNKWFHQHFNAGGEPARYLALHPPMQFHGHAEKVEDRAKDQIEYVNEDPWVRAKFEGGWQSEDSSLMPEAAYGSELGVELVLSARQVRRLVFFLACLLLKLWELFDSLRVELKLFPVVLL